MTEPTAFQHWITDPVWNATVGWVVGKASDALLGRAKAKLTEWTADTDAQARAYLEEPALETAFRAALLDAYAHIAREFPGDRYPGLFTEPFFRANEPGGEEVLKLLTRDGGRDGRNPADARRFAAAWTARPGVTDMFVKDSAPTPLAVRISRVFLDAVQANLQRSGLFSAFFDEQVFDQLPARLDDLREQLRTSQDKLQEQLLRHNQKLDELLRLAETWAKAPPPVQINGLSVKGDWVNIDKIVITNIYGDNPAHRRHVHLEYLRDLANQPWAKMADLNGDKRALTDLYVPLPCDARLVARVIADEVTDWWVAGGASTGLATADVRRMMRDDKTSPDAGAYAVRSRTLSALEPNKQRLSEAELAFVIAGEQRRLDAQRSRDAIHPERENQADAEPRANDVDFALTAEDLATLAPRLVLLGAPGSGKSSFAQHFALLHAIELRRNLEDALSARDQLITLPHRAAAGFAPRTPVYIPLRQIIAHGAKFQDTRARPGIETLKAFLADVVLKGAHADFAQMLERLLVEGQAILIFDGLDEVDKAATKARREQIVHFIDAICKVYPGPVLITSRPNAYKGDWKLPDYFYTAELADLGEVDQHALAQALFAAVMPARGAADSPPAERFVRDMNTVRVPNELRVNPLFLTLLARLWVGQRHGTDDRPKLPESRAQLYRDSLNDLIERWRWRGSEAGAQTLEQITGLSRDALRRLLERAALRVHATEKPGQNTTEFGTGLLHELLRPLCDEFGLDREEVNSDGVIRYIVDRTGILREDDPDQVKFWHRSFQEHLAACELLHAGSDAAQAEKQLDSLVGLTRAQPELWRNVLSHALDKLHGDAMPMFWDCLARLSSIGDALTEAQVAVQGFENAERLAVLRKKKPAGIDAEWAWLEHLRNTAQHLMRDTRLSATERAAAGRAAARCGDTSPEAATLKGLFDAMATISAGAFQMGSADSDELAFADEKPLHLQTIKTAFRLAHFPVTNAQYRAFVDAGGYSDARWWAHAGEFWQAEKGYKGRGDSEFRQGPVAYRDPFGLDTHPVVGVSWDEAVAFTLWLTEHARKEHWIAPHEEVRLPSEAEWERACRGNQDARVTPWDGPPDPQRSNYSDSGIGATSAVGCFRNGATAEGCEDMIGNVWEWTLSKWTSNYAESEDNTVDASGSSRVLRGGSWVNIRQVARAAYRGYDDLVSRFNDVGFRVVCAPVPRPSGI